MAFFTALALYFIFWWVTLFAMLPVGLRTQAEENNVTLGTTESAPLKPRMGRTFLLTTIVSGLLFALYYYVTQGLGYSVDDIPHFYPDLK
ncbi:MAG: DUF1467 family protein [Phyllobacterium sp.]